jgi:choline dehydrogenase-like flavoprotein
MVGAGPTRSAYDVVIVGSGMGGGTLAYGLMGSGASVLVLERGGVIPREAENWDAKAVFADGRYRAEDEWQDGDDGWYRPSISYAVGGNTKVYGAALPRFRPQDFGAVEHAEGVSPAWPFRYDEIEQDYARAEQIYGVHAGPPGPDEPPRSGPFPHPAVPHEPLVEHLAERLTTRGYRPAHLPLGIDLRRGGTCVRCNTCDGFVCQVDAKADAHVRCLRPAVAGGDTELVTHAFVRRVLVDSAGRRATSVEFERGGQVATVSAGSVVVAAGAVNSAALLLRSAGDSHPTGLANASGTVGRHYMVHNNTVMLTVQPLRRNRTSFQKTLYLNDFYENGTDDHPYPLGHIQLIGKVRTPMVMSEVPRVPRSILRAVTDRSLDWWLFTEDLPDPDNRVELTSSGRIRVRWRPNNVRAHEVLVREARRAARAGGYPIALTRRMGIEACSHQAGTIRAGTDPGTSALTPACRAHDVENLWVADASFFPSLPVMNPALTIAANALRVSLEIGGRGA